jgi:hypothetical protein
MEQPDLNMMPRDQFPWIPVVAVVVLVLLVGWLIGYAAHVRNTKGTKLLADFRALTADSVVRILLRPMPDNSREAKPGAMSKQSLSLEEIEITDRDDVGKLVAAFQTAQPAASEVVHGKEWISAVAVVAEAKTYWFNVEAGSDGRVLLFFWSDGLKGWSLGVLQSDALFKLLPAAAHVVPAGAAADPSAADADDDGDDDAPGARDGGGTP